MNTIVLPSICERIKKTRKVLGYSRKQFEENFGIPSVTLQSWESGKHEITTKAITRFVDALKQAGLNANIDWFLYGTGSPPYDSFSVYPSLMENYSEDEIILREVNFFEQLNTNAIVKVISDDTMTPMFNIGDYVGGHLISGEYASKYIETFCLVFFEDGRSMVRKVKQGSKIGHYNLISTNLDTNSVTAFVTNCKIYEIAQIVWHRKSLKITTQEQ